MGLGDFLLVHVLKNGKNRRRSSLVSVIASVSVQQAIVGVHLGPLVKGQIQTAVGMNTRASFFLCVIQSTVVLTSLLIL